MPTQPDSSDYVLNFRRDSEIWYLPVWKDRDDAIIQNKAKGPYPKPQVEPVSIGIIKAEVRKASYTDADFANELNAINSGEWRDQATGNAWIGAIRTHESNEGGVDYTIVKYIVYTCEYGWKSVIPEIGYYYLDSGTPKVFTDDDGNPYIGCLDGSGGKLSSASDMILTEWNIKRAISFSVLGF